MTTITSRTDLIIWLTNSGALDHTTAERVASDIQDADHPAWGSDWEDYLGAIDVLALASEYTAWV